jgi:4-amino-4-deoxy-L-arabinose transferase-like glycosyltransferase
MRSRWTLAGIVLLGLALRLPGFRESLWHDEVWSTRVYLSNVPALIDRCLSDAPPGFYLLMYSYIRIFGDSEIAIRALPLLFGLAMVVMSYVLARR